MSLIRRPSHASLEKPESSSSRKRPRIDRSGCSYSSGEERETSQRSYSSRDEREIFVGMVPDFMTKSRLRRVFSRYGEIEEGPLGFVNGKPEGFAYILYKERTAAEAALVDPVKRVDDCNLVCRFAAPTLPPPGPPVYPDPYKILAEHYVNNERNLVSLRYSFEDKFGNQKDRNNPLVSRPSFSVVGLCSFTTGGHILFACSGCVYSENGDVFRVVTSASLITAGGNSVAPDLQIRVYLHDGSSVLAVLCGYDWHYNIAIVSIKKETGVDLQPLDIYTYESVQEPVPSVDVYALGRHYSSGVFMATHGNVLSKSSNRFDCDELVYTTCKTTKCGIGGPLIDGNGFWVGMIFFDDQETPFLPAGCIVKCIIQLSLHRKVFHPSLGLTLNTYDNLPDSERILVQDRWGLVVLKVVDGSVGQQAGIQKYDILTYIGGVPLTSVAQFAAELLILSGEALKNSPELLIENVYVKRIKDGTAFRTQILCGELKESEYNRWPVPLWSRNKVLRGGLITLD